MVEFRMVRSGVIACIDLPGDGAELDIFERQPVTDLAILQAGLEAIQCFPRTDHNVRDLEFAGRRGSRAVTSDRERRGGLDLDADSRLGVINLQRPSHIQTGAGTDLPRERTVHFGQLQCSLGATGVQPDTGPRAGSADFRGRRVSDVDLVREMLGIGDGQLGGIVKIGEQPRLFLDECRAGRLEGRSASGVITHVDAAFAAATGFLCAELDMIQPDLRVIG